MPSDILLPSASFASGLSRAWRGVRSILALPEGGLTGMSWTPRSALAWADKAVCKRRFLRFVSYQLCDENSPNLIGLLALRVLPFTAIGLMAVYGGVFVVDASGFLATTEQVFNFHVLKFLAVATTPWFAIMCVMRANCALHGPLQNITGFSLKTTNRRDLANGLKVIDALNASKLHVSQWNATFVARVAAELGPQDARDITLLLAFPGDPAAPQGGEASELLSRVAEWVSNTDNAAA